MMAVNINLLLLKHSFSPSCSRSFLQVVLLCIVLVGCVMGQEPTDGTTTTNGSATTSSPTATSVTLPPEETNPPLTTPGPTPACYVDLVEIEQRVAQKNAFVKETYVLCPNTTFEIGSVTSVAADGTPIYAGGSPPINVRANTRYLCGDSGLVENNCIIHGGLIQLTSLTSSFNDEDKDGVVFQGITFEDSGNYAAIMVAPGEISFIDCAFRNHNTIGAASVTYDVNTHLRRNLAEHKDSNDRNLQNPVDAPKRQKVTFDGCLFETNNYSVSPPPGLAAGVLSVGKNSNDVIVRNCVFKENDFGDSAVGESHVIFVGQGSTLDISTTCFILNDIVGRAAVVIEDEASLISSTNVYGSVIDDGLICQYISFGLDEHEGECMKFDSSTCLVDESLTVVDPNVATSSTRGAKFQCNRAAVTGAVVWGVASVVLFTFF